MNLLEVRELRKTFRPFGREPVTALDDFTLDVPAGAITGVVGESGSGKSTAVRCIVGLDRPDSGAMQYDGTDLASARKRDRRRVCSEVQIVFQDPSSSLNPRMTAEQLVGEGLRVHGISRSRAEARGRAAELMELVGLDVRDLGRYPRSFSGGQRQRIAIARALAVQPRLLICDEAVSALDVSVQAQILNLLLDMQKRLGLTVLFVAHDLAVVRQVCDWVAVVQGGSVIEQGACGDVLDAPRREYTRSLMEAVPVPDPIEARRRAAQRRALLGAGG